MCASNYNNVYRELWHVNIFFLVDKQQRHSFILQALVFTSMGAILCCTAGLVLIRDWDNFSTNLIHAYLEEYSDQMVAAGSFAIIAAFVFAIDTYFTNKYDWSYGDSWLLRVLRKRKASQSFRSLFYFHKKVLFH